MIRLTILILLSLPHLVTWGQGRSTAERLPEGSFYSSEKANTDHQNTRFSKPPIAIVATLLAKGYTQDDKKLKIITLHPSLAAPDKLPKFEDDQYLAFVDSTVFYRSEFGDIRFSKLAVRGGIVKGSTTYSGLGVIDHIDDFPTFKKRLDERLAFIYQSIEFTPLKVTIDLSYIGDGEFYIYLLNAKGQELRIGPLQAN